MTLDLDELERKARALRDVATPSNEWGNAAVVVLALIARVRELDRYKAAAIKTMDALTREYEALERAAKAAGVKDA